MAFYDTVRNPRDFALKASSKSAQSFQMLKSSAEWKSSASTWGLKHLFACRVVCIKPTQVLSELKDTVEAIKREKNEWDSVLKDLIRGPNEDKATLGSMSDVKILRQYNNDGLGHLWAALSPLVKFDTGPTPDRQLRQRNPSQVVESQGSSSREASSQTPTPSVTESTPSSIGYHEAEWAPLLEDITVIFASCFIRHVLAFCQPADKVSDVVYRAARMAHKDGTLQLCAINDGGIQVVDQRGTYQVAILEAKRAFQTIQNGSPTISDELLAQMVGEALGVIASGSSILRNKVITILAIKQFVKFLSFTVDEQFMSQFKTMDPAVLNGRNTYLVVNSTVWFDAAVRHGRESIVSHLMALVDCADEVVSP
ncbi:uncharacterized protein Triagg1_2401 [Trichoderma aggressivum f. europaeum]|uniref:Uncharacterized protein n=1 Tax=Trichoderma aggressivum f. europaeum TaxID=173218 RepID=A0AAE1M5F0_9HYPO|nr:hypothetical protein Triagg1_2401 [Trichoderma aggressivum f. europaeum]